MSFMIFPPEINSSLMYSGVGSGPLMAAASAWDELAADLEASATAFQETVAQLTGATWLGPSSARMASATTPYVAWLDSSAAQAAAVHEQLVATLRSGSGAYALTEAANAAAAG